ncbi:MAG: class C sortase [Peptoniphilus sp.]|nr:class C sortase [Peptoniphilus sp.]MDD7363308.1 class C sortase [Bacillota bacterium]MDY6045262.1 class C sortase [Peptoniphilus sp.]
MKRNKSVYVILGYLLIMLGISLPLYGFANMSYRQLDEKRAYEEFLENRVVTEEEEKGVAAYNAEISENNVVDPFTSEDYSAEYEFYKAHPDEPFAYLEVPKLGINKPVYLDASYKHLDMGVAHIDGTSLPVSGAGRRSVIAGHRGWYRDLMFFNLHKLEAGDDMFIVRGKTRMHYKVSDTEVILPSDWDALQPREGEDMVTLLTCSPLRPPRPRRLLVNGVRVPDPEEAAPVEATGEASEEPVDPGVKTLDDAIFGVTILGFVLLFITMYKLIKYLRD